MGIPRGSVGITMDSVGITMDCMGISMEPMGTHAALPTLRTQACVARPWREHAHG